MTRWWCHKRKHPGSTHHYLFMAGNSHQINFSRKHTWVLPGCFLLWHHQRTTGHSECLFHYLKISVTRFEWMNPVSYIFLQNHKNWTQKISDSFFHLYIFISPTSAFMQTVVGLNGILEKIWSLNKLLMLKNHRIVAFTWGKFWLLTGHLLSSAAFVYILLLHENSLGFIVCIWFWKTIHETGLIRITASSLVS